MKTVKIVAIPQNDSFEEDELPEGWKQVTLSQISELIMGQSPPGSTYNTEGVGVPFFQGKADFTEKSPTVRTWCTQPKKFAKAGDILISVRAPIGPTNVADRDCSIGRGLAAIRPKNGIPTEYILYYLKLKEPELALSGTGSTFTAIKKENLANLSLPLPPLAEQQRIVARIEALLSHVDAAGDRLSRVPAIMKRFRQSVLAAACSGRLTEEWREENPDVEPERVLVQKTNIQKEKDTISTNSKLQKDYSQSIGIEKINENEIPESWELTNFGNLFSIQSGEAFKKSDYSLDGYKLFQIANVGFGKTVWDQQNFLPKKFCKKYEKIILREGDICIALNRPILGNNLKVTKISNLDLPAILYQRVGCLRSEDPTIADYTLMFMLSDLFRDIIRENLQGTDQPYLNFSLLSKFAIPLPPLVEQHEIVRRVGLLFERADAIEREVAAAGQRCERLTQAVMVNAFSGRL